MDKKREIRWKNGLLAGVLAAGTLCGCRTAQWELPAGKAWTADSMEEQTAGSEWQDPNAASESASGETEEAGMPVMTEQGERISEEELAMRYYYGMLGEEQQRIYRDIVQGLKEYQETITIPNASPDEVNQIFSWILMDDPAYFWLDGSAESTGYSGLRTYCELRPSYTVPVEEIESRREAVHQGAKACLDGIPEGLGEYERIRAVFDYLVDTTDYVSGAQDSQNIYSVFVRHQSVCAGYARAFQYLMNRLGIFCIYVTGTTGNGEAHAWNIVRCNGEYYNVDVTWGDPMFAQSEGGGEYLPDGMRFYDYLCCSDADFRETHVPDASLILPACTRDDLEYYRSLGRYFDAMDYNTLLQLMKGDIDAGLEQTELKISGSEAFFQVQEYLGDTMQEAATYLCERYGLPQVQYRYSLDTATRKIIIYWEYCS